MKKIFSILLLFIICLNAFAQDKYSIGERTTSNPHVNKFAVTQNNIHYVLSTPYVDTAIKIYDYANVLKSNEQKKIQQRCKEFINKTGLDIAIVTLSENTKEPYGSFNQSETYISDFYDYNDFKANGVMLLLDFSNNRNTIFDAGELYERNFMGSNLEYYGSQMRPLFDMGHYYDEIMWFIENTEGDYLYDISFPIIKCSLFALLFAFLFWTIHRSKYKLKLKATSANNYKKKGSFVLTQNKTDFVRTFTTKTYSPRSSGGSGGGHGSSGGGHSGGSF